MLRDVQLVGGYETSLTPKMVFLYQRDYVVRSMDATSLHLLPAPMRLRTLTIRFFHEVPSVWLGLYFKLQILPPLTQ